MKYRRSYHTLTVAARRQGARHRRPDRAPTASTRRTGVLGDRDVGSGHQHLDDDGLAPRARASTTRPRCCCPTRRVLLAGGGAFGTAHEREDGEIYSPPYLFKGPRPTITGAPGTLQLRPAVHGRHARRGADPEGVARPHGLGHAQLRHGPALHARSATRPAPALSVQGPTNANVAPPGWYMVFSSTTRACRRWRSSRPSNGTGGHQPAAPSPAVLGERERRRRHAQLDRLDRQRRRHRVPRAPLDDGGLHAVGGRTGSRPSRRGPRTPTPACRTGTYYYRVVAADAAGNASPPSREEPATVQPTRPRRPCRSPRRRPAPRRRGTVSVTRNATDNRGVRACSSARRQRPRRRGHERALLGELGHHRRRERQPHADRGRARRGGQHHDLGVGHRERGQQAPRHRGLVAAYGFEERRDGRDRQLDRRQPGTISGATRSAAGSFGSALSFDGVNDLVTVPDSSVARPHQRA